MDGKTFTVKHYPGSGTTNFSIEYHDIWLKKESAK